jgi:deoxyhypusine synthase
LPDCVVAYVDSTIALPLLTAYCLSRVKPRKLKRLYDRRDRILNAVKEQYLRIGTIEKIKTSRKMAKRSSRVAINKTLDRDR